MMLMSIFSTTIRGLSLAIIVSVFGATGFAQIAQPLIAQEQGIEVNGDGLFSLSTDRQLAMELDRVKKYVADERFADAVELLESILKHPTDHFFKPDLTKEYYRSMKSEARRILGALPQEGRENFELHFAAEAERMLKEAIAEGNFGKLSDVARIYFYTPAGYEATWLYGRSCLDHGQPLAAAINFQLLRDTPKAREIYDPMLSQTTALAWWRAGINSRAITVLRELRVQEPTGFAWNGERQAWFAGDVDVEPWMSRIFGTKQAADDSGERSWGVFRGNAERNARANAGSPLLNSRWETALGDGDLAGSGGSQSQIERELGSVNRIGMPTNHPLAVGNTVLVQKHQQLLGIDFKNGKLKWLYPPTIGPTAAQQDPSKIMIQLWNGTTAQLSSYMTSAKLSSSGDERQAYFIEESNAPFNLRNLTPFGGRVGNTIPQQTISNVLSALNLEREGYLKWQVGGPGGESEPRLAGVYFFGAPLPLHNRLYVLGEVANELNLYCLDATSGKLVWSQPLGLCETPLATDLNRRITSLVPTYSNGVMICPTNSGKVVAVDVFNRCLLWAQTYNQNPNWQIGGPINRRIMINNGLQQGDSNAPRWADGTASVAGGKVVIGPADGDELICYDLLSGEQLWRITRSDMPDRTPLYVASVDDAGVVVVGKNSIFGLSIAKKEVLYSIDYAGGQPSGRGYRSGNSYYLPLNTAEVVKIDLAAKKIASRSKSRKSIVPGNLIVHQGQIVSVGNDLAQCFYSLDDRQDWVRGVLESNPNDPAALYALGEIELNSGKPLESVAHLEKAYRLDPQETGKALYTEAMLQALRMDFDARRASIARIKELIVSPRQAEELSRMLVESYLAKREYPAALNEVLILCRLPASVELEEIEPGKVSLRRDRWIQAMLNKAAAEADPREWQALTAKLRTDAEALIAGSDGDASQRMLSALGRSILSDEARLESAKKLLADKQLLDGELRLMGLERSGYAPAFAAHAEYLEAAGRREDLAMLAREIETLPAGTEIHPGSTAAAYAAELFKKTQAVFANAEWPTGSIAKTVTPRGSSGYRAPIEIHWDRAPFYRDVRLEFDGNNQELYCRDGQGTEAFKINMNEIVRQSRFGFNANMSQARFIGRLLLINVGFYVAAYDTTTIEAGRPKQIWRFNITTALGDDVNNVRYRQIRQPNGRLRMIPMDANNRPLCTISFATRDLVCFARGSKLFALDVRTGEIVWIRHDVRTAGEITGDEKTICVFPENSNEVVAYSAIDGHELVSFKIPSEVQRIAVLGTKLVTSESLNAKQAIKIHDLSTGKVVWTGEYALNARAVAVDQSHLAIFEQKGTLSMHSLDDGKLLFQSDFIHPEPSVSEWQVIRDGPRFLVVVGRNAGNKPNTYINGINNGSYSSSPFTGHVYAFDAKNGKPLWERKVEEVSLLHNQPQSSPVFVLGSMVISQENNANVQRQKTRIVAIDKRTGEVVCDESTDNGGGVILLSVDVEKKRVQMQTTSQLVQLTYGEKAKDEPEKNADAVKPAQAAP